MAPPSAAGEADPRFGDPEIARGTREPVEMPQEVLDQVRDGACPVCGGPVPRMRRVQPMRVKWPTDVPLELGDFVWPVASSFPLVRSELAAELAERFAGFEPGPVEVHEHRVRASDGKEGARLPAQFLEQARQLVELWIDRTCAPDARTTLREVRPPCRLCGLTQGPRWGKTELLPSEARAEFGITILEGVEWWETSGWDREHGSSYVHHPREPGRGLYVSAAELGEAGFFVLDGVTIHPLCTDEVKAFVEERRCTNVAFLEAGEVVGS